LAIDIKAKRLELLCIKIVGSKTKL